MSGYHTSLVAAGAQVLSFYMYGDYQGAWLAHVESPDGRTGWIRGAYGSCSGCDAFEAEFGYDVHSYEKHPEIYGSIVLRGTFVDGCEECAELKERLIKFGQAYLTELETADEIGEEFVKDSYWSRYSGDHQMIAQIMPFIRDGRLVEALQSRLDKENAEGE